MVVTRHKIGGASSTDASRTVRRSTGQRRAAASGRGLEAKLLAAAIALALLGLLQVYRGVSESFPDIEDRVAAGEVVLLDATATAERLEPILGVRGVFDDLDERSLAADHLAQFLSGERTDAPDSAAPPDLANVFALSQARIDIGSLDGRSGSVLGARAAEADDVSSIPLFDSVQLRRIKDSLIVRRPAELRKSVLFWGLSPLLAFVLVHLLWRWRGFAGDQLVLPILVTLTSVGNLVMVAVRDPLRDALLFRPFAQGVIVGCLLLAGSSQLNLERSRLRRVSFLAVGMAAFLSVLLVAFGDGPGTSDAKVNLFGFQPVELIKVLVVLFLAGYFVERWELLRELEERRVVFSGALERLRLPKLEYLLPPVVSMLLVLLFFFLQRDLGPALVLSFLFLCLYYVARGRLVMVTACLLLLVLGFTAGYRLGIPSTVAARIDMWLSPWDNAARGGEHLAHSLWSFASGALSGTGLGRGQASFVPEVHTDMVLTAVGEELGLAGLLSVLGLYSLLLHRGFRAAVGANGVYSFFLALGLTLVLGLQIVLIAGGVLGFLPLSGVVTPFISYGRSAMLANFVVVGLLLAISAHPGAAPAPLALRAPARRLALVLAVLLSAIAIKAATVQAFAADRFAVRGTLALQGDGVRRYLYNPRLVTIANQVPRGSIIDRNGVVLATSERNELASQLAVYRQLGIDFDPASLTGPRFYPLGGTTFHLLGNLNTRVNWAASNTSFVERDSAVRLQGYRDQPAPGNAARPLASAPQRDYSELMPLLRDRYRPSKDTRAFLERDRTVRLTIDARLQHKAAEILQRAARRADRSRAAMVVLEVGSGEVLASVSLPYPLSGASAGGSAMGQDGGGEGEPDPRLFDRARYGVYPPGSTFKLVTAIAALRKSPDLATEKYLCKPLGGGRVGHPIRGWRQPIRDDPTVTRAHGQIGLFDALTRSCNAYFAQLATFGVGAEELLDTAQRLGIEVAQPNTTAKVRDLLPQAGYGQGQVLATPLEMARLVATLAGGGRIPRVHWLAPEDGDAIAEPARLLDRAQAERITGAMRRVVTEGSASRALASVLPEIAGKTGTAEVAGRPSHSWFIGYAPYDTGARRQIAFSIVIENGGYGGRAAAQAARDLVQEAVSLGLVQ